MKNNMTFILLISLIILLRIGELILSKRNEKWLLQNGAIEYGQKHYPLIVALHVLFIISLIIEYSIKRTVPYNSFLLVSYISLLVFKTWVILSLGKFWNTKIYRIRNYPLIKKGLYRYFKHPNYMIVVIEIAVIPLIFHLYFTAAIFTLFNAIMLSVRIKEENKVL
ncbi:isoprenylcysteine carboxyl methyltransferase family protein [Bacteroides sedimenti]|uniref:Isoprenylcysteine carboxyl methyltransferase n=1 Tax=Bacteroides sedimenti TaxID=2136147 RepID=A0ABM8IEX8_9BACE